MLIGITTETKAYEKRVAITPDVASQLMKAGFEVCVQAGAGINSYFSDDRYTAAGVKLENEASKIYQIADVILKVNAPSDAEIAQMKKGAVLISFMMAGTNPALVEACVKQEITAFSVDAIAATNVPEAV